MDERIINQEGPTPQEHRGWWFLDEDVEAREGSARKKREDGDQSFPPVAIAALVFLIILADRLFWDTELGISIALYALALSVLIIAFKPKRATRREIIGALAFVVVCNLPVIEQVQLLSLAFSAAGLAVLLAWAALGKISPAWQTMIVFFQASSRGAMILPLDIALAASQAKSGEKLAPIARAAALPVAIVCVFGVLFTVANPLIESTLSQISFAWLFDEHVMIRLLFWAVLACLIWPYLNTRLRGWADGSWSPQSMPALFQGTSVILNKTSVRSSLLALNAMFALQTLSDISILTGGMSLPDGMTYAQYAHRGAYPLILTALLSGAFAMVAHRIIADDRLLRQLMYVWLGQNLFLVLTAAFRLAVYIDAYTLTYLRVVAFIWMALVFVSLILIILRLVQDRSMAWLVGSTATAVTTTLYICCFVNFAYLITTYNMASQGAGGRLDLAYLCGLGEQVIPAMMDYSQVTDQVACGERGNPSIRFDPIEDWREWGFRRWRLQRYLERHHDL